METSGPAIAIVDDDPRMGQALQRLLRLNGFTARSYASGAEFLASLAETMPSCLILDLKMPDLTGFDVLERLAAARAPIAVVAVTGHHTPSARARAFAAGGAAYLRKPVSEEALIGAIEGCAARGSAAHVGVLGASYRTTSAGENS